MTKKYIVKNCPNRSHSYYADGKVLKNQCGLTDEDLCKYVPNCLIKQVVERCKKYNSDLALTGYQQGKEDFANEILQLFTIEEVE